MIKMWEINEIINYKYDIYVSISILIDFIIFIEITIHCIWNTLEKVIMHCI